MLSTLDQESPFEFRSYEIQSIPPTKTRIDQSDEPGEQTLFPWWSRAQHSWHEGAGQDVFDSPFSSRFKFFDSKGLNPWTEGEISLLKDTMELRSDSVDDHHLIASSEGLFYTFNGNLKRDPDPDITGEGNEETLTTYNGLVVSSVTSDGESFYASISTIGIEKTLMTGTLSWTPVNDHLDVDIIGFVKGRLMGAKNNQVFEYDLSSTDVPEPYHTDEALSWKWTAITESGPAIYFSGFAGDRSEIYAARLTAQDIPFASVATLGAMRSVWQAPEGETIHTIKGYVGQQLLIGTSRGVRVGTIVTEEGDLRVSNIIAETNQPVHKFEPQEEFAWFSWSRFDALSSGIGRIHLGTLAYSSDLMYPSSGETKDIALYNDRLYFTLDEGVNSRIIKEHATDLVADARLTNKEIRVGTTERKIVRYFDLLIAGTGKWSLSLGVNGGPLVAFTSDNPVGGYQEEVIDLTGSRFSMQIQLDRDDTDNTLGPTLLDWRMRSEPQVTGRFRYLVPIMVYDYLTNATEREVGFTGFAFSLLDYLQALYRTGEDIQFEPPSAAVPGAVRALTVTMEDLRFKEFAPPAPGGVGFGGICLLVLREVR